MAHYKEDQLYYLKQELETIYYRLEALQDADGCVKDEYQKLDDELDEHISEALRCARKLAQELKAVQPEPKFD